MSFGLTHKNIISKESLTSVPDSKNLHFSRLKSLFFLLWNMYILFEGSNFFEDNIPPIKALDIFP